MHFVFISKYPQAHLCLSGFLVTSSKCYILNSVVLLNSGSSLYMQMKFTVSPDQHDAKSF